MKFFQLVLISFLICNIWKINTSIADEIDVARENAKLAQQSFVACMDYVHGWLSHRDPQTGMIPRNLTNSNYWNAKDSAADNYPFMVLSSVILNPFLFDSTMKEMLTTEKQLTNRVDSLPDDYSFDKQGFRTDEINMDSLIFGGSEYVKDGLLPLTEWLGESPWSDRMVSIVESVWKHASHETAYGMIPSDNQEVNGEQLQTLSRLYWFTGNEEYKEWAFRIADYYFFDKHPMDQDQLRLRDHSCEIVSGLAAAYYLASHTDQDKKDQYKKPLYRLLDGILEKGRNEDGLFYNVINPQNGDIIQKNLSDNWGYNYNAFLNVALIDNHKPYRDAVIHALNNIHKYTDYSWEGNSADGYADSIEGGLNLLNRIPVESAFDWVDQSMQLMLDIQREDGVVEGWHGDGNFARTALMYALWKTKGITLDYWRADLQYAAVQNEDELLIWLKTDWPWSGKLKFDYPRHQVNFNLPSDYPRINQFPEWFTVNNDQDYVVKIDEMGPVVLKGNVLKQGLDINLNQNQEIMIRVSQ